MTRFAIPADHPSLPGHFPGLPIVPGVLLLDEVMQAIARRDGTAPTALLRAKFTAPVAPEEAVELELGPPGARVSFTCRVGARVVARGEFGCPSAPSR
ncbi:hypothetical protein [Sabulicella rubraurantiaca]|uniref:hypothetical protein n=1 Tax=Sabulicella rubraurantiaca TaxID=2811429 RepID=UPI001A972BD1|nr:hypothetical protein [Sabulicella rubraurantiaca]